MRGGKTTKWGGRAESERRAADRRAEPASVLLRRIGRVVLWVFIAIVVARGLGAIFSGDPESLTQAQAEGALAAQTFPDDEARAYAVQFTRAFLTFTPAHPDYHELSVRPFLAAQLRESAALELPERGASQTVTAATVARAKLLGRNRALVTVAATVVNRTVTTRYLTVPVARDSAGGLVVYDYPAFSSPPPPAGSVPTDDPGTLEGPGAKEIPDLLRRFFAAYLDGRQLDDLSYFLIRGARVTPLVQRYRLRDVLGVSQVGEGVGPDRTVLVTMRARDPETRAEYTLRYRAIVVLRDRWYVKALVGGAT
ncbi:MAG: conjugal transfer protein [Actinobacteria bacterium]|nr:conjugal transfer protein [Actinomycetota bacterium]